MSSSSENDLLDFEQLHEILRKFYTKGGADMVFRSNACAFFEETVAKRCCVAEDPSFTSPSSSCSCLVYSCYSMIKNFQETFVKNFYRESSGMKNENLLGFFIRRWTIFESGSIKLDFACQPIYAHFSKHHLHSKTFKVHELAFIFWHLHCSSFSGRALDVVMKMINTERTGASIDTALLRESMRLLVHITDIVERDSYCGMRRQEQIDLLTGRTMETEFMYYNNVCSFYKIESNEMLRQYSAVGYIRKVKNILVDEYRKCRFVYRMSTHFADYIQLSLSRIFIESKKSVLVPDFINALANKEIPVLEDFFFILRMAANANLLDIFSKGFYDSVCLDGKNIMEKRAEEILVQPELYIVTVLQVMRKYNTLVRNIFDVDENFMKATEEAVSFILNSGNKGRYEPGEYLAVYCDFMLQNPKGDTAHSIYELSCLFMNLENKYLFEKTFYELLVKSLICATTINEQYVKDISLLINTFWNGSQNFITIEKIGGMIKDIKTSKDLTDKFSSEISIYSADYNSELVVKVLKDGNWPFAKQSFAGTLPKCLSIRIASFSAFHKKNHPNKKLAFLHQVSQAEVITHCFGKKYNFHLNLNQLILLLQFNKAESFSITQLLEDTKIDEKSLDHVIQNFIEAGILKYKDDDSNSKTSVMLNLHYNNQKDSCVRLSELKDGIQEAMEAYKERHDYVISEENKCLSIQAAIVRIMKKELLLNHEELVTRTFEAMKTKFDFTTDMVNKSIDKLIKSAYIGRSQESERSYVYIP